MGKATQDFIKKISKGAIEAYDKYGVLPSLTLAQGILESGSGRASIGNNIFGIKASPKWKGKVQRVRTAEYDANRKKYYIMADFRDYDSIEDCIIDHAKLLTMPRYKNVISAKNYKEACIAIQSAGYATDPKYSSLLISIIEYNKLYEYDKPIVKVNSIDILFNKGIIGSKTYWNNLQGYADGEFVSTLLRNYCRYITGKVYSLSDAVDFIQNQGLISSGGYWIENAIQGGKCRADYVNILMEKLANSI